MEALAEKAHTPGPWAVEYAETRVRWPVVVCGEKYDDGSNVSVCEVSQSFDKDAPANSDDRSEAEANARLIAAAPELLEACVSWIAIYEEVPMMRGLVSRTRAAIAKAIGEG